MTKTSHRYKIVVGYDGTNYAGWQVQPRKRTVQEEIEKAIESLTNEKIRINSSGRTDSGVHARGQVAHFDLSRKFPEIRIQRGINRFLDYDIRIMEAKEVTPDFDARFSATGKEYRYFIWNGSILPPHVRLYRAHVYQALDIDRMIEAAELLLGRHDFSSFSANPGYEREDTVRTIHKLKVVRKGPEISFVVRGDGFMFKMVRSIAGCLLNVGKGNLTVKEVKTILQGRERVARIPTAPAHGLFLWRVFYGKMPTS